jgi:hypothetical protein
VILALLDVSTSQKIPEPLPDDLYVAVSDIEDVYERAKELGCLWAGDVHGESGAEIRVRPWGERSFYAVDPFGNGICFVDERTLFTGR